MEEGEIAEEEGNVEDDGEHRLGGVVDCHCRHHEWKELLSCCLQRFHLL